MQFRIIGGAGPRILEEPHALANGHAIPKLGPGMVHKDGSAAQAVRDAVEIGYHKIDTAQA